MGDATETHSARIPFVAILLLSLCLLPMVAQENQEPSPPKHDPRTETKMKVTVDEVRVPPKGSAKEVAHLLVKSGTDSVDVYLCSKSFFRPHGHEVSARETRSPSPARK